MQSERLEIARPTRQSPNETVRPDATLPPSSTTNPPRRGRDDTLEAAELSAQLPLNDPAERAHPRWTVSPLVPRWARLSPWLRSPLGRLGSSNDREPLL